MSTRKKVKGLLQEAVPVGIFKLLIVEDFLNRMVAERNKFAEQLLELNFLFFNASLTQRVGTQVVDVRRDN
ncbi:uncharacterized protein LOC143243410 isoform X3 [Tachypleus tridentatus]|uniref:uncharacterized protein LOC143243410 isoform X3 n=1 Tax=Tachypleus tridentatus TaxID=6853 RepID=UPI003FD4ADF7